MPTQLKKLALIEDAATDNVVTFSVIQEGAANASRQVIEIEPADGGNPTIENERELITSKTYRITVVGLYSSSADKTQIETWASNQTSLTWVGIGLDDRILYGEGELLYQEDYEDNLSFRFERVREGSGGYSSSTGKHTSDLSFSPNGLALYKFGDASGNEEADGWVFSGGTTVFDDANEEQDFSTTAAAGQEAYRQIYFPFAKQVALSLSVDAVTVTTGINLKIEEYDESDTLLNTTTQAIASTGTATATVTLNASTVYVRCIVEIGQDDSISFSAPAFSLGSTANFVEFNT